MTLAFRLATSTQRQASSRLSLVKSHVIKVSPAIRAPFTTSLRRMAPIPPAMKAVVIDKTGGPEVLRFDEKFSLPQLNENEILVQNELAGINFIDTYFRNGLYPAQMPLILGQEAVGKVVATKGNTADLKVGDEVIFMKQGTYAQYSAVPAEKAVKLPPGVPKDTVLGSFLMGMTALGLVRESYPVQKGDKVLVHAAAGGVGLLLCQLLKDLGATVYGTASTKEKCELAKANGADYMINYKENPDWVSEVKKLVPDGLDCVYDSVGKDTWEGSLEVSKRKGHVIYFGNASGPVPPLNIALLSKKNTKIMRMTIMNYIVTREELETYSGLLFKYLQDGKLKAKIHKVYDLNDLQQAHKDLEGRLTTGKSLIKV